MAMIEVGFPDQRKPSAALVLILLQAGNNKYTPTHSDGQKLTKKLITNSLINYFS